MASRKKAAAAPQDEAQVTGTEMVNWDEELARQAEIAAGMEANTGGAQWFSTKGGVLQWNDAPVPGNQMAVIILDHLFETTYYPGKYNPDEVQTPAAFALGRDEKELRWHETSEPEFAGQLCSEHEVCKWGSADVGRGKAARETRRMALIPAGSFDAQGRFKPTLTEEHIMKAQIGLLKLPVTSVAGFATYVKQLAEALKRPMRAMVTRVRVIPDPKNQWAVTFEAIQPLPNNFMTAIMKRVPEAVVMLEQPYGMDKDTEAKGKPAAKGRARAPAKGAAKRPKKY